MEKNKENTAFIIQMLDMDITSNKSHELKEALDREYKYLVGIAIADVFCSETSIIESVKVKGMDIIPEDMEAIHILCSRNVAPNKRFFSLFVPMAISGDDITIRFRDPDWSSAYRLQVHLLLTNNPKCLQDVLYC